MLFFSGRQDAARHSFAVDRMLERSIRLPCAVSDVAVDAEGLVIRRTTRHSRLSIDKGIGM